MDDMPAVAHPVPIRGEVVAQRVSHGEDVRERCYALWSTRCARNCRATARHYAAEGGEDAPTPTYETIRRWAIHGGWEQRRRDDFERNHGDRLYDMQLDILAIMDRHIAVMAEAQAGAFDANPAAGIVRLKPGELVGKIIERGVLPLMPRPRELPVETASMTREEMEDEAMTMIARGRRRGSG